MYEQNVTGESNLMTKLHLGISIPSSKTLDAISKFSSPRLNLKYKFLCFDCHISYTNDRDNKSVLLTCQDFSYFSWHPENILWCQKHVCSLLQQNLDVDVLRFDQVPCSSEIINKFNIKLGD